MSKESVKQITSDFSDFEIINHLDSELDTNGYLKAAYDYEGYAKPKKRDSPSKSNYEHIELVNILSKRKSEKKMLSLSQEQVFGVHNYPESEVIKPSRSANFSIPFSLVPIKIPDDNSPLRKPNLPEIVLTSFESSSHGDKKEFNFEENRRNLVDIGDLFPRSSSSGSEIRTVFSSPNSISPKDREIGQEVRKSERRSTQMKPLNLNKALPYPMSIDRSHRPSASASGTCRGLAQISLKDYKEPIPSDLKCRLCDQLYKDPRALNCLHSFCLQCLIAENVGNDSAIPFWSEGDSSSYEWTGHPEAQMVAGGLDVPTSGRPESRPISHNKKPDKNFKSSKKGFKNAVSSAGAEKLRTLVCSTCQYCTEMPLGGIYQLPQNSILVRKIENLLLSVGSNVISSLWCNLCCEEIPATYLCVTCAMNLCGSCKDAHERQRMTAHHNINNLLELRKLKECTKQLPDGPKFILKCSLHPGFELKSFCITCQQIICSDCSILLHKDHKCEGVHKIFQTYHKIIKDSVEKTKPLSEYANHSISKLASISKKINQKCDQIQHEVEIHIAAYFEALEVHRNTLLQQVTRARETKIQMILEQQLDLEKRSSQAKAVVEFSEELVSLGSEPEILSFVNILLKRFEFCAKYRPPLDPKISDTLHFLPEVRAPSTKAQNNIPLYGIITTQTVEPNFCTLETEGYDQLRVHRKAELIIFSRDGDGVPLCHGGLTINAILKYKDAAARALTFQISDRRDGSYVISFTPDMTGILVLSVTINGKHIKGSPFTLGAKTLRPHTGIYHCCAFCSSKGSKTVLCACKGVMAGFKGCGHGHTGHPGRRHWSCCASVLENSECTTANKF